MINPNRLCLTILTIVTALFYSFSSYSQSANEIIDYQSTITLQGSKLIQQDSYVIQINRKEGELISEIEIDYDKADKIEIIDPRITDLEGKTLRELKKKEIVTRNAFSSGSFYNDQFVKEFNLKWHSYPYQIRYTVRRSSNRFIYLGNWYPSFNMDSPTRYATLELKIPADKKIRINTTGNFNLQCDTVNEIHAYRWEIHDVPPVKKEIFAPSLQESLPHVTIIPVEFEYGQEGSFESWALYGQWQDRINQNLDVLTKEEALKVKQLTAKCKNDKEKIQVLYNYLQDYTRYINVSIKIGGLKPYPASYVCTNKYGDCKALTIYMKAMLKEVGIPSYYTTVYAGVNPKQVNTNTPAQQFNHVILTVPNNGDTIYLENTSNYSPFKYYGTSTQGRKALLVDGSNSHLIDIPALTLDDVECSSVYELTQTSPGKCHLQAKYILHGYLFEKYNYCRRELDKTDLWEIFHRDLLPIQFTIKDAEFAQVDRNSPQLFLSIKAEGDKFYRKIGTRGVLKFTPLPLPKLEQPAKRKYPIRINYPINKIDKLIYEGSVLESKAIKIPESVILKSKYGNFSILCEQVDNQIIVTRKFQLFRGGYPIEEYPEFHQFFEQIKKSTNQTNITFNLQ
ncbi:DUF3857 domain-containing protein [Puteibacter caeruleilacunae]|nr:DUF3857 domain-containing protein [Puteibacter caeruleilacunae]